jgi:putative inorganic carbon (hco3(-)) transporter
VNRIAAFASPAAPDSSWVTSRRAIVWVGIAAGLIVCAAVVGAPILLEGLTLKKQAFLVGVLACGLVAVGTRHRERIAVAGLLLLAPVYYPYYPAGTPAPHVGGAAGWHIGPADLPLALLYLYWLIDWGSHGPARGERSIKYFLLFLPFLAWLTFSIVIAYRPEWGLYEWMRWLRVALILIYTIRRFPAEDIRFVLLVLAASLAGQSALALMETGAGIAVIGEPDGDMVRQLGGMRLLRGRGTVGHPNVLGSYIVLLLPAFLLLARLDVERRYRVLWTGVCVIGLAALAVTMSRAAWISFVLSFVLLLALAVWFHFMGLKRALKWSCTAVIAGVVLAAPLTPLIVSRITGDLDESMDFRALLNWASLDMIREHPIAGVGLNNWAVVFERTASPEAREQATSNGAVVAVHNLALLVWTELGTIGLLLFFGFFLAASLVVVSRATRWRLLHRVIAAGLVAGLWGMIAADMLGFSLWMEPVLFTTMFLIGFLEPLEQSATT